MAGMAHKRMTTAATTSASVESGGDSLLERVPESILNEIFLKSGNEEEILISLCSVACVSRALYYSVNQILSSFSSFHLSTFSLDSETLKTLRRRFGKIKKITLDCLCMRDSSIAIFLGPHVEELTLLKCSSLSFRLLTTIGLTCPNIRVLAVEFSGVIDKSPLYDSYIHCPSLKSITIKVRKAERDYGFTLVGEYELLPDAIQFLVFKPTNDLATRIGSVGETLTHISLVLDFITDQVLDTIANGLPLLVELDLEDRPRYETINDLSNTGIQSLVGCKHLTSLSLIRNQQHILTSFKRVTDTGMLLLSVGCKRLESVRLGGFTELSDSGFTLILYLCLNLKKFEIQNSSLLTDFSFKDVTRIHQSLEVLNLLGCKNVEDSCISNVSRVTLLTSLNLGGTNVTDVGMSILGKGNAPISSLSLRACTKVTDKGIEYLLRSEGKISQTLSSLDLGHMPGITDNAISTIAAASVRLTELCIRNCLNVTDASVKALAHKGRVEGERGKLLRRLDVYNCTGISAKSFEFLKNPLFRGLHWFGTHLCCGDDVLAEIHRERRWLFICVDGCEVGCQDGWQSHIFCNVP